VTRATAILRWVEANAVGSDGQPLILQPWQRALVEDLLSGKRLVLQTSRRPDRAETDAVAGLLLLLDEPQP
jgi:hypothetical protein